MTFLRTLLAWDDPWVRPRPTSAQVRRDLWLALGLAAAGLLALETLRASPVGVPVTGRYGEAALWTLAMTLPLAARRRFPITAMLVVSVAFYGMGERVETAAYSPVVQVTLFMAIYAAWAWSRHRIRLLVASAVMVAGMFAWLVQTLLVDVPAPGDSWIPAPVAGAMLTLGVNVVYFFGAIAWGQVSFRDARRRQVLAEQADALRAQQEVNERRAVADERLRIARDLHDVVAHHVTGIGVQAAAARHVLAKDPDSSAEALAAIEGSSRSAVAEMHRMVGLLRSVADDAEPEGPRPGLADLERWAADPATRDPELRLRVIGDPAPVPQNVQACLHRVAQEAVANVRQHSTATSADLVLRHLDGTDGRAVEVEVIDDGSPTGRPSRPTARTGFGLQGIHERAQAHGGEAETGPRPEGGWRVRVRVPLEEVAR